jgi:hypothetical protein
VPTSNVTVEGATVTFEHHGAQNFAPVWAGEGYPADVSLALRAIASDISASATPVVVARHLSPGSRALLTERGVSWADEAGGLDLTAGPVLIRIPSPPAPPTMPPARFTAAAGAVAEHLLHRCTAGQTTAPPVDALAAAVHASRGAVSRALTYLDSQGWTTAVGPRRGPTAAREVSERGALLDAWSTWYAARKDELVGAHTVVRDPAAWITDVVAPAWPPASWAVTGLVALETRAPIGTTPSPIDLYLDGPAFDDHLDTLLASTGLRRVATGVRVRVLRADRYTLPLARGAGTTTPFPVVGDIRLLGDLLRRGGVRATEYATHLREQRIGF